MVKRSQNLGTFQAYKPDEKRVHKVPLCGGGLSRKGCPQSAKRETGAKVYTINTSLYPTKEGDDYFSIMERNLSAFVEGLDCRR